MALIYVLLLILCSLCFAENPNSGGVKRPPLTEAQVFEWWDNSVITPEEANEMLLLLDEGNETEACLLAEVYAQFPCEGSSGGEEKEKRNRTRNTKATKSSGSKKEAVTPYSPNPTPSGYFVWKARLDSNGRMVSHREELLVNFYRYRLRLGSQELLTYSNGGSEVHFGDISTREVHSHIPIDTLWGTALLYPIGHMHIGGLLDTSLVTQGRIGFDINRKNSMEFAYWHRMEGDEFHSFVLQTKTDAGRISAWWQKGQSAPLIKIQMSGKDTDDISPNRNRSKKKNINAEPKGNVKISWRTTAYYHEDSVPTLAHLSSTILNSRLWGSQTVSAAWPDYANTKLTAAARLLNPLQSDSVSTRLKMSVQSGPNFLRGSLSTTCIEAGENCRETDWKGGADFRPINQWTFGGSAKVRYTRDDAGSGSNTSGSTSAAIRVGSSGDDPASNSNSAGHNSGFGNPRLELSILYEDAPRNYAKLSLVAADGNPARRLQVQDEIHLNAGLLDFSLLNTFARTPTRNFHPTRSSFVAKVQF